MNAELKTKWLDALRSGKYEQGKGRLYNGANFCCLGVLCDISGLGRWVERVDFVYETPAAKSWLCPPEDVTELAGLSVDDVGPLWRMNDGTQGYREHSFQEIAEYIETNL